MKLEWDFSELTEFAERLSNSHSLNTALMTATQKIAKVLHQHLLTQTPVDTGNLRKMWSAGDNLLFTVERVQGGFQVTLINTARNGSKDGFMYGLAVNDGHKTPGGKGWVMGRFFVERSIIQTVPQTEQIIMRELQKWWESV
jgi:hypothetical protein